MNLTQLYKELDITSAKVEALRDKIAKEEVALALKVTVKNNESSFTLTFGNRVLNVKKNSRGRLTVKENGKVLDGDYVASFNSLRKDIAFGNI